MEIRDNLNDFYVRPSKFGEGFDVMGVGVYEKGSVLEGQDRIVFVDSFSSIDECEALYPKCKGTYNNELTEPQNTFDHLSDIEGVG